MNDITMPDSNTPIFNQLKSERGYDPKFPHYLTRKGFPFSMELPKPAQEAAEERGYMAPGAWIAKKVPQIGVKTPVVTKAFLTVNIHPEEAEHVDSYGMEGFIRARCEEFAEKHPNATNVTVTSVPQLDGTYTITVSGDEKEPTIEIEDAPQTYGGDVFHIRGASSMPPVVHIEHKIPSIREDLSERQLALYRVKAAQKEQTGTDANAGSTDVPTYSQGTADEE
jgi:hypothetical protein